MKHEHCDIISIHLFTFFLIVCDPVMGDEGKLYVPPELVSVYREKVSIEQASWWVNASYRFSAVYVLV